MKLDYVWVLYHPDSKLASIEAEKCVSELESLGIKVKHSIIKNDEKTLENLLIENNEMPNLAVVLGGDGTVLRAARFLSPKHIPIINFNVGGNLGFLTHDKVFLSQKNLWERISKNMFSIQSRMMLNLSIVDENKELNYERIALNDFYFRSDQNEISPTCNIALDIDGERVDEYKGDGLIISTSTGSTAYSVATGGPILHPNVNAIIVSAICPMSLSSRPIVIPESSKISIKLIGNKVKKIKTWADGMNESDIRTNQQCLIQKSIHQTSIIILKDSLSYYRKLSTKLGWKGNISNSNN
tara:strand:+ start:1080 stop:1973 length:894 start_codon:yes stop_codon:yes gene_type:complete